MTNVKDISKDSGNNVKNEGTSPMKNLVRLCFLGLLGVMFLSLSSLLISNAFDADIQKLISGEIDNASANDLIALKFIIVLNSVFAFIIPALLYNWVSEKKYLFRYGIEKNNASLSVWGWSLAFFALSLPLVMASAWINQQIPLPEWAHQTEQNVSGMLKLLMGEDSLAGLAFSVFALAFLPALGEEWFFRGSLQRILLKWMGNASKAILVTGFIFSLLHFEFEGFIPRFLLGMVLGYIFYSTGNIWISVFLHFLFNATQIVMAYFTKADISSSDTEPLDPAVWILVIICTIALYLLFRQSTTRLNNTTDESL